MCFWYLTPAWVSGSGQMIGVSCHLIFQEVCCSASWIYHVAVFLHSYHRSEICPSACTSLWMYYSQVSYIQMTEEEVLLLGCLSELGPLV